jgi:transposase
MLSLNADTQYYLYSQPIDMRKSIDGLSALVFECLEKNPQDGSVYIFHNKRCDKVKWLHWDKNGFVVYYKRLERHRFKFNLSVDARAAMISREQLGWLLAGLDFTLMAQFNHLDYTHYY